MNNYHLNIPSVVKHIHRPSNRKDTPQYKIDAGKKIMQILKDADVNKDGCYTKDEIKKALKDLGSYFPGWKAVLCMWKFDENNDGQLSDEEIGDLVNYLIDQGFGKKSKK